MKDEKKNKKQLSYDNRIKLRQRYEAMKQPHIRKKKLVVDKEVKQKKYEKSYNNIKENLKLETTQMYSTFNQYLSRINMIIKFYSNNSHSKEIIISKIIFKKPKETIQYIIKNKKNMTENTIHNLLTVLLIIIKCSRFLSKKIEEFKFSINKGQLSKTWKNTHCEIMLQNRQAFDIYSDIIYSINKSIKSTKNENLIPKKSLDNYISLNEIKTKYIEIRKNIRNIKNNNNYSLHTIKSIINDYTLLTILLHIPPKRADYGNVEIFISKNIYDLIKSNCLINKNSKNIDILSKNIINIERKDKIKKSLDNYLILDTKPNSSYIIFRKYKTAQHHQILKEYLSKQIYNDILYTLYIYPRSFLFIQNRGSKIDNLPYINNNSFTQFFIRTFKKLFGKRVGCSMFRHIFITEKIDPSKMSLQKQHEYADRMLHSHKEQMQYRWNNIT